jgi:hypothetical protein
MLPEDMPSKEAASSRSMAMKLKRITALHRRSSEYVMGVK